VADIDELIVKLYLIGVIFRLINRIQEVVTITYYRIGVSIGAVDGVGVGGNYNLYTSREIDGTYINSDTLVTLQDMVV